MVVRVQKLLRHVTPGSLRSVLIIALVAWLGTGTVMLLGIALVFALIFLIVLAKCALVGLKERSSTAAVQAQAAIFRSALRSGVLKEGRHVHVSA